MWCSWRIIPTLFAAMPNRNGPLRRPRTEFRPVSGVGIPVDGQSSTSSSALLDGEPAAASEARRGELAHAPGPRRLEPPVSGRRREKGGRDPGRGAGGAAEDDRRFIIDGPRRRGRDARRSS